MPDLDWALTADVEYWSNKLWDLEYETDSEPPSEEESDGSTSDAIGAQAAPGPGRGRSLRQREQTISYSEVDSKNETRRAYGTRRRVVRLVEERENFLAALTKVRLRSHPRPVDVVAHFLDLAGR